MNSKHRTESLQLLWIQILFLIPSPQGSLPSRRRATGRPMTSGNEFEIDAEECPNWTTKKHVAQQLMNSQNFFASQFALLSYTSTTELLLKKRNHTFLLGLINNSAHLLHLRFSSPALFFSFTLLLFVILPHTETTSLHGSDASGPILIDTGRE